MRVWNGRSLTLAVGILGVLFARTATAQPPPQPRVFVNDSVLTVDDDTEVIPKRNALIQFIWGTDGFPPIEFLPSHVQIGTGSNEEVPISPRPQNLERVDTLTISMGQNQTGYAHHFIPVIKNNRLVVFHHGHDVSFDDDGTDSDHGMQRTLNALLYAGYSVLAVYMPHQVKFNIDADPDYEADDNTGWNHDWMFGTCPHPAYDCLPPLAAPPNQSSPIRYFLEPVAASLNYLKTRAVADGFPQYVEYNMIGLSGGGWATTMYAAVDPTIKISIDIAGTLPLYMRWSKVATIKDKEEVPKEGVLNEGDEEQLLDALYSTVGYLDLYVLASTGAGRHHLQLINFYDECCFGGTGDRPDITNYSTKLDAYELAVHDAVEAMDLGGGFRLELETDPLNKKHQISDFFLYDHIFPTLGPAVSMSSSPTLPSQVGVPITWTVDAAAGGLSPLEYQFSLYSSDGWRIVQNYGASNTFTWTPAATGTYALLVGVRLIGSTVPHHSYVGSGLFTINAPATVPTIGSFTANVSFPQPAGAASTWTATASGGVGPLQYQFSLFDPFTGAWSVVREYSSTNTYTWRPLRPGNYQLRLRVRSAGSTADLQAVALSSVVTVTGVSPVVLSLTADKPLPVAVNTPLVWKAEAAGGTTPLEYQFWRGGTSGRTLVQDYGLNATYSWTPTTTDNWVYLEVWVRQQGSTASAASLVSSAFQVVSGPVQMVSFTANQTFPLAAQTPIVWTTRATGGTAPLQYKFLLYDRSIWGWTTARDWSTNPQFTWTPARSEFGVHAIQVVVRSTGSTVDESSAAPGFFLITP